MSSRRKPWSEKPKRRIRGLEHTAVIVQQCEIEITLAGFDFIAGRNVIISLSPAAARDLSEALGHAYVAASVYRETQKRRRQKERTEGK
jgi:hypothetical protein